MKSFSPNPRSSASSSKNKNLTNNRMENNTINLTLKSDKFVVIPNNKGQNSPSTLLPNVYQSIDESQFINIYNNNDKNDINKKLIAIIN